MTKRNRTLNLFYIPALAIMIFFVVVPLFNSIRYSLFNWNGYDQTMTFAGLKNYTNMFKDRYFISSFLNTLLYGIGSTLLQNVVGLAIALFLNSKFKGRNLVRAIVYMPIMISGLVMGYILYYFVQYDHGVFNEILGWFGRSGIDWMANATRGKIIMTLINSWQFCGISMMIYLAGLQNIPSMYLEAASIDGVTRIGQFRYITLPLLIPSISTAVILNLINSLKLYDIIIAMTNGGPALLTHSLSTYISYLFYTAQKAGYASAIGIFTFVFILVISILCNRFFRKREVEA